MYYRPILQMHNVQLTGSLAVCVQLHVRNPFDYPLSIGNRKIAPIHAHKKLTTQLRGIELLPSIFYT